MNWFDKFQNRKAAEAIHEIALQETINAIMRLHTAPKTTTDKGKDRRMTKEWHNLHEEFYKWAGVTEDAIMHMGKTLVRMLEIEPDTKEILLRENPNMRLPYLHGLEQVGNGRLHPGALRLGNIPMSRAVGSLPIEQQNQVFLEGILVMDTDVGPEPVFTVKKPAEVTYKQASIAIGKEGLRSKEEQIQEYKRRKIAKAVRSDGRYEIVDKDLVITCRCRFTPKEAEKMFAEWQKAQKS